MWKLFQNKVLIIFLTVDLLYLSKINANENSNNNRKKNAIKYILSKTNIVSEQKEFNFIYPKYNITYSDFSLLMPINNNQISISDTDSERNYIVDNLITTIKYSNKIQVDSNLYLEETDNICEITFNGLIFNLVNEFITLSSNKPNYILSKFSDISKISKLNYFKDFNEKKKNPIYLKTGKEVNITDFLSGYFGQNFIIEQIKDLISYKNLLTYDLKSILDLSINLTIDLEDESKNLQFKYIKINNYEFEESRNNIEINQMNKKLSLSNLKIDGSVHIDEKIFKNFTASLCQEQKIYLDYSDYVIKFLNDEKAFDIFVENGDNNDFENIFNKKYMTYLISKSSEYYNN